MCRNIGTLHNFEPPATEDEVHAAVLQYVRRNSGSTKPWSAVEAVVAASRRLLGELTAAAPPEYRHIEIATARDRYRRRQSA